MLLGQELIFFVSSNLKETRVFKVVIGEISKQLEEVVNIRKAEIDINNIPKEVSNVSFVSNLVNSTNIVLNIDELIQSFTKDN